MTHTPHTPHTPHTQTELQQQLKVHEARFAQGLPARLQEIADTMAQCMTAPATEEAVRKLHRLLHSMAGTAGTFAYMELAERSRDLEKCLAPILANPPASLAGLPPLIPELQEFLRWAGAATAAARVGRTTAAPLPGISADTGLPVYLVGTDPVAAEDLATQLRYFGFEIVVIGGLAGLMSEVERRLPAAVILELGCQDPALNGAAEIARLRERAGRAVPVVILCRKGSFDARLAAVRAGADGYFQAPVDVLALSHRLDALMSRTLATPYRILTVDDDEISAAFYATVLRGAGMEVKVLNQPGDLLRVLGEYRPELVLMDVYMPDYSGIELTQIIRQDNTYLDVPVVFLSSEHDPLKQLAAIQSGADDFLVKPIEAEQLVSAISHRAKRYRALRGLIMRDSLTGLFNHSAIKEHLIREIVGAQRADLPLALAVIDLDFFKRINDDYGHMSGDQVLRALSRLLQQWMRRSDIIGRYGGEEFVVILPGTSAADAAGVLDHVRDAFSRVRHHADEHEFTVTFSVGVADLGSGADADALFRLADEALYRAKHRGRNRVEQA